MKKLLSLVLVVLVLGGCLKLLALQDQYEKNRAITRCGSESNLVEHYTQQGDIYFTCKVDK